MSKRDGTLTRIRSWLFCTCQMHSMKFSTIAKINDVIVSLFFVKLLDKSFKLKLGNMVWLKVQSMGNPTRHGCLKLPLLFVQLRFSYFILNQDGNIRGLCCYLRALILQRPCSRSAASSSLLHRVVIGTALNNH